MTLVVASSTARATRPAVVSSKPAPWASFFVRSRTRERKALSLGIERTRSGFPTPWLRRWRLTASGGCPGLLAEAHDGLHLGGEDPVEMIEPEDLEDVEDGLVQVGEAQVAAVRPDLLDRS